MRSAKDRLFVAALVLLTAAYAVAEEITLTTFYPSPRGVYRELRVLGDGPSPPVPPDRTSAALVATGQMATNDAQTSIRMLSLDDGDTNFEAGERGWFVTARGNTWDIGPGTVVEQNDLMFWRWDGDATPWLNSLTLDGATGNVGIGTSTPGENLTVVEATGDKFSQLSISTAGDVLLGQSALNLVTRDLDADGVWEAGERGWHVTARGDAFTSPAEQNDLMFWRWDGAWGPTPAMSLDFATSRVGIGTSAPDQALDVRGHIVAAASDETSWLELWYDEALIAKDDSPLRFGHATDTNAAGWREGMRLAIDGSFNQNLGVGNAYAPATAAPNLVAGGNIDANDVWLRGADRWASQSVPSLNIGNFIGGDDFDTPGTNPVGGTLISQVQWVKCPYQNGGGVTDIFGASGPAVGPAVFSCYWRRYNDGCGAAPLPACPNRSAVMAVCPQNWKVLGGGAMSYHGGFGDIRPDGVLASYPNSWNGYNRIPNGGGSGNFNAIDSGNQEGWVMVSKDSSGFDVNVLWASCGN